jgi:hypothetical protein
MRVLCALAEGWLSIVTGDKKDRAKSGFLVH